MKRTSQEISSWFYSIQSTKCIHFQSPLTAGLVLAELIDISWGICEILTISVKNYAVGFMGITFLLTEDLGNASAVAAA